MDVNATFWHIANVYFTYIRPHLWLITVQNMNTINPFFLRYHNKDITFINNIAIIAEVYFTRQCSLSHSLIVCASQDPRDMHHFCHSSLKPFDPHNMYKPCNPPEPKLSREEGG